MPQVKAKKRTPVLEEKEYQHILNVLVVWLWLLKEAQSHS